MWLEVWVSGNWNKQYCRVHHKCFCCFKIYLEKIYDWKYSMLKYNFKFVGYKGKKFSWGFFKNTAGKAIKVVHSSRKIICGQQLQMSQNQYQHVMLNSNPYKSNEINHRKADI